MNNSVNKETLKNIRHLLLGHDDSDIPARKCISINGVLHLSFYEPDPTRPRHMIVNHFVINVEKVKENE